MSWAIAIEADSKTELKKRFRANPQVREQVCPKIVRDLAIDAIDLLPKLEGQKGLRVETYGHLAEDGVRGTSSIRIDVRNLL